MRKAFAIAFFKAPVIALASIGTGLLFTPILAEKPAADTGKSEAAVLAFIKDYEKRDKASDLALINLYDDGASIESEIERKDEPIIKKIYSKEEYKAMMAAAFANPANVKASQDTIYGKARIQSESENSYKVEFTACHGDSAQRITWRLKGCAGGNFKISKEQSLTYRRSLGAVREAY